jgi:hypothetical protein
VRRLHLRARRRRPPCRAPPELDDAFAALDVPHVVGIAEDAGIAYTIERWKRA